MAAREQGAMLRTPITSRIRAVPRPAPDLLKPRLGNSEPEGSPRRRKGQELGFSTLQPQQKEGEEVPNGPGWDERAPTVNWPNFVTSYAKWHRENKMVGLVDVERIAAWAGLLPEYIRAARHALAYRNVLEKLTPDDRNYVTDNIVILPGPLPSQPKVPSNALNPGEHYAEYINSKAKRLPKLKAAADAHRDLLMNSTPPQSQSQAQAQADLLKLKNSQDADLVRTYNTLRDHVNKQTEYALTTRTIMRGEVAKSTQAAQETQEAPRAAADPETQDVLKVEDVLRSQAILHAQAKWRAEYALREAQDAPPAEADPETQAEWRKLAAAHAQAALNAHTAMRARTALHDTVAQQSQRAEEAEIRRSIVTHPVQLPSPSAQQSGRGRSMG
ncbi:hypothetical protein ACFW9I_31065 [[Kitasatospora] papulosa]|uniref:hypothetical protein n=1 Tax=[Kitasatospora] papulosa TaxID=1464011 RepID=UPI00369D3E3C